MTLEKNEATNIGEYEQISKKEISVRSDTILKAPWYHFSRSLKEGVDSKRMENFTNGIFFNQTKKVTEKYSLL